MYVLEKSDQPNLPLDERFREAEQYAFDLTPIPESQPKQEERPTQPCPICIGNCNICQLCDNN